MAERGPALVFGEVADAYDEARPGYPTDLVDDVLVFAGVGAGDRVLEVGSGTGKATTLFAARGVQLLCLEPSAPMARIGRRAVAAFPNVSIEEVSFEEWVAEPGGFGLVFSAQAWHWVAPEVRYAKAREVLVPGGALALFWNRPVWEEFPLKRELDEVYERLVAGIDALGPTRAGGHTSEMDEAYAAELAESGLFGEISVREYPWTQTYRTGEYIRLLGTHSDHRMLPDARRSELLSAIAEVIDEHGGEVTLTYVTRLYLARPV